MNEAVEAQIAVFACAGLLLPLANPVGLQGEIRQIALLNRVFAGLCQGRALSGVHRGVLHCDRPCRHLDLPPEYSLDKFGAVIPADGKHLMPSPSFSGP